MSCRASFLNQALPARACALWPRLDPTSIGSASQRPRPSICEVGAEPYTAHAPAAAPPTPHSAGFGHFRLFVLNSARLFSPPLGGDPEGAAPPPPPGEPPRAPARPPPETQVSEPAPPGLARAPAPQAAASAHGRQKAASPAPSAGPGGGTLKACQKARTWEV